MSGGLAKIRIGNVRIDAAQPDIIEDVESIRPKHEPQVFEDLKIPGKAQVLIHEVRVA